MYYRTLYTDETTFLTRYRVARIHHDTYGCTHVECIPIFLSNDRMIFVGKMKRTTYVRGFRGFVRRKKEFQDSDISTFPSRLVSSSSSLILINFREKPESGRKGKATKREKGWIACDDSAGSMVIRAMDNSLFRPCGGWEGWVWLSGKSCRGATAAMGETGKS